MRVRWALQCIRFTMQIKSRIFSLLFVFLLPFIASPQEPDVKLQQALQLELAFRDSQALQKYLEVVKEHPNNITALCKASQLLSVLGKRQPTREKEKEYYRQAVSLAETALKQNSKSAEANFSMSVAMGRMALIESGGAKIQAVKDIKAYADRAVQLDPTNFKSYHVLGKWYYEVSDLNSVAKWLVKVAFGALPKATVDDAIRYYEKSLSLNPKFVLTYLELAKAYQRKDNFTKARTLLNTMLTLPASSSDDATIKEEGRKMLRSISNK